MATLLTAGFLVAPPQNCESDTFFPDIRYLTASMNDLNFEQCVGNEVDHFLR